MFANQKSWSPLKTCDAAFKSGDLQEYRKARLNLQKGIKEDKCKYKQCIEDHFKTNNSMGMWQGIKTLIGYKGSFTDATTRALLDTLNHLFDRQYSADNIQPALPVKDNLTQLTQYQVRSILL